MALSTDQSDLQEFIAQHATPYDPATDTYRRPPFAQPVKAGKNSPIYNAHSYHTKVPPKGIVPYIEHYTDPGDLILDPFCGSGMTGVAALMTGLPLWRYEGSLLQIRYQLIHRAPGGRPSSTCFPSARTWPAGCA